MKATNQAFILWKNHILLPKISGKTSQKAQCEDFWKWIIEKEEQLLTILNKHIFQHHYWFYYFYFGHFPHQCFWREGVCGKTLILQNLHGGAFIIYPGELTLIVRFAVDVEITLKYYRNRFLPKDSLESELILVLLFLSLSLSKLYLVQLHWKMNITKYH